MKTCENCEKLKVNAGEQIADLFKASQSILAIAAEVNAVGNAGKDPAAAIEAIGKILGEPF